MEVFSVNGVIFLIVLASAFHIAILVIVCYISCRKKDNSSANGRGTRAPPSGRNATQRRDPELENTSEQYSHDELRSILGATSSNPSVHIHELSQSPDRSWITKIANRIQRVRRNGLVPGTTRRTNPEVESTSTREGSGSEQDNLDNPLQGLPTYDDVLECGVNRYGVLGHDIDPPPSYEDVVQGQKQQ